MKVLALLSAITGALALINPILPGWNPDPSIIRVEDDYFIATSTFEYFPGHPIYHSKDLIDWTLIGHGLNRPSQLSMLGTAPNGGMWAPTLRYQNGTYYLVCTTRYVYTPELRIYPRSFFITTSDIFSNNWSDPIYFDSLGFDPDLFWDTNGDVYNSWAGINNNKEKIWGIWQNRIDIETGTSLSEAQLISNGTMELTPSSRPEGPHVYLINGTYYLLLAEGGTGITHRATIQRGPSPSGPWENNPANPILYNGANRSLTIQCTGHADLVEGADGQWWGTALGVRGPGGNQNKRQLGRETFLFPVHWEDGWPIINNGEPITENMPHVLPDDKPLQPWSTNFTEDTLDHSFYFIRTPIKQFHALSPEDGLTLHANSYTVGDRDNPAAVLRRQISHSEVLETELDFPGPGSRLQEAGVGIFTDDFIHNEIGVTGAEDGSGDRYIVTRNLVAARQIPPWPITAENNTVVTTKFTKLSSTTEPVKLRISATWDAYTLSYAEGPDAEFVDVGRVTAEAMSSAPPLGGFFKGAGFVAYNTGHGRPSLLPAKFRYWKQTPV